MRQRVYRELEALERKAAAAQQARASRDGPSPGEVFRGLLSRYDIEQLSGESLAEAVARAAEIGARDLKNLLWERALLPEGAVGERLFERCAGVNAEQKAAEVPLPNDGCTVGHDQSAETEGAEATGPEPPTKPPPMRLWL